VGAEGAARGLCDVEDLQGDRPDLGPALGRAEGGILEDPDDLIGVGAELVGRSARPGRAGQREQQQERGREPARQAMTLMRA
jgi:hypothetical protein